MGLKKSPPGHRYKRALRQKWKGYQMTFLKTFGLAIKMIAVLGNGIITKVQEKITQHPTATAAIATCYGALAIYTMSYNSRKGNEDIEIAENKFQDALKSVNDYISIRKACAETSQATLNIILHTTKQIRDERVYDKLLNAKSNLYLKLNNSPKSSIKYHAIKVKNSDHKIADGTFNLELITKIQEHLYTFEKETEKIRRKFESVRLRLDTAIYPFICSYSGYKKPENIKNNIINKYNNATEALTILLPSTPITFDVYTDQSGFHIPVFV